jgi:hypothetical protein
MKLSIGALFLAAGIAACGDARGEAATAAQQEDFKRDLQLASSSTMNLATPKVDPKLLNSLETKPMGAPEPTNVVKRGAGNRAVHSHTPTVRATPEVDIAAVDEVAEVESESIAPAPEVTNEPVAVAPRPAPVVIQTGGGDYGTSGNGGGVFGGGGGIGGVVIRGGGVDGDNCDLHRTGRRPTSTGTFPGPIYRQPPRPSVPRTVGSVFPGRGIGSRPMPASSRSVGGIGSRIRGR